MSHIELGGEVQASQAQAIFMIDLKSSENVKPDS